MDRNNIVVLLQMLGSTQITVTDRWVRSSCVFARWTHQNGTDNKPSFGISIGERSSFNCFACGSSGPLTALPSMLFLKSGMDFSDVRNHIYQTERLHIGYQYASAPNIHFEDLSMDKAPYIPENVFNETFSEFQFIWRGVSQETVKKENLRFDTKRSRIMIPIRDQNGKIVGVKGRTLLNESPKYLLYTELSPTDGKKYGIWYGMHHPLGDRKIIIVEGELDAILMKQEWPKENVWGCMGVGISRRQLEELGRTNKDLVLFLDNDRAGEELKKVIYHRLKGSRRIYEMKDYHGCNDPAEAHEKGLLTEISVSGMQIMLDQGLNA